MDLFNNIQSEYGKPLAEKLRPQDLDEILDQEHILGKNSPFRSWLKTGQLPSLILWGPPGCGKTTLARALSQYINAHWMNCHSVDTGAKQLREMGEQGRYRRIHENKRTVLFLDEIHRLNKAQQDVLLPYVEQGDIILVGATTENPSFELNSALQSRCHTLILKPLSEMSLLRLLEKAAQNWNVSKDQVLSGEAQNYIVNVSAGDARRMLNWLDYIMPTYLSSRQLIDLEKLKEILKDATPYHDKKGSSHYEVISAFIKSMRGSDPNAAIYYLARMIEGGENPLFIARRLVIFASEDVGNADPKALPLAIATMQAVDLVGLPECSINLAQAVTYLASAPKSNRAYSALLTATDEVKKSGALPVPLHIRNAETAFNKRIGFGSDYKYPHDYPKAYVKESYLPEKIKDQTFYKASERGYEKYINQYFEWIKSDEK